ncbi:MAG TPA: CHAT domain-containing tetratricopeptide repeat protein, partial [Blastocatellia bacterium]|nr:CHAT domain-containing tetratricopeptide repeat protein [Blastocatellia bacterium]
MYSALGERQKALEYFSQALSLHRAVGNRAGEATTLGNIGLVYNALGERQKALEYYSQALSLHRAVGNRTEEATTLNNIGQVYADLGERQKALEYYTQALPIFRAVGDRAGEATTLGNIGYVYFALGERQKALEYYTQALPIFRAVGDRATEATTLNNIGYVYFALGERQKALEHYGQALALHRAIRNRDGEVTVLGGLAVLKRGLGDLAEARAHLEDALRLFESLRAAAPGPELRASFFASKRGYYEFYIDLLLQLHEREPGRGHDLRAFEASERARARSLLELLAEARIEVTSGIAPELKARERAIHARIAGIQRELLRAHARARPKAREIAALEEALKRADEERQQLELEIRRRHPRYAELQYPEPVGVREVQARLDEQTALLEYVLGREGAILFVVTREGFQAIRLGAAEEIRERVRRLREAIAVGPLRTAWGNYVVNGRRLYQQLVEPAERWLAGKRHLLVVPDGALYYLPFEVLLTSGELTVEDPRRLPYLVRSYAVSYVPSASVWVGLWRSGEERPEKTFLAYADPVYGEARSESAVGRALSSAFGELRKLPPLRYSRREVEGIARLYSAEEVKLYVREQAREENVKGEALEGYRYVHFATHGVLNEQAPSYSGLVLTLPSGSEEGREDGLLQVYEVFNLKVRAELVVLSACETGLGQQMRGEGVVGLTRGF